MAQVRVGRVNFAGEPGREFGNRPVVDVVPERLHAGGMVAGIRHRGLYAMASPGLQASYRMWKAALAPQ